MEKRRDLVELFRALDVQEVQERSQHSTSPSIYDSSTGTNSPGGLFTSSSYNVG
jgi:hypothetical protein